jgi:hypothetical protein
MMCVSDLVVTEEREGYQAMAHLRRVEPLVRVLLKDRSRMHERFAILGTCALSESSLALVLYVDS